jgi:lipopolysaccharide export system permease protein
MRSWLGLMDFHIGRAVVLAVLVVLLAFTGLNALFPLIDELADTRGDYGAREALAYVGWSTPRRIYELMPFVVFMGALVGLGTLANQSELVVLRASGVSVGRLFASVCIAVAPLLALNFALGEWLAPWGEARAEALQARAQQGTGQIRLGDGLWHREGETWMSVSALDTNGDMVWVRQYQRDDQGRLTLARTAATGRFVQQDGRAGWLLEGVHETRFRNGEVEALRHAEVFWPSSLTPELLTITGLLDARRLALTDLSRQIVYMRDQNLNPARYELAYWNKLAQPAATLGLILVAVAFILGPLREKSMGTRVATGILVGLGFKYLQDLFGPAAMVWAWPAWIAVFIPVAACWLLGAFSLRRVG